jgi:hypothetical protein
VIPLTLSPVGSEAGESRSEWPRLRDSIPIVEARRRAHYFLRKVDSIGAKSARNTAALPAEVTPGVVALPAAAVAITGPYGDAGRALNLPARGARDRQRPGSGRFAMQVRAGGKPDVAGERHHAAGTGSSPRHEAALMRRQGGSSGREGFRAAGLLPSRKPPGSRIWLRKYRTCAIYFRSPEWAGAERIQCVKEKGYRPRPFECRPRRKIFLFGFVVTH